MSYKIISKFIKDISFEIPNAQTFVMLEKEILNYSLNFDIKSQPFKDNIIEVSTILKTIKIGNPKFIDQNHSQASYAKKIDKKETKINWNMNANKVLAHIHGLSPNPGAWFEYKNERFKVLRAKISTLNGKSSSVLDENLTIACRANSIQILELQRQGKKKQTTKEFLQGKKISSGSILN